MPTSLLRFGRTVLWLQKAVMIVTSAFIVVSVGSIAIQRYVFRGDLYGMEEFITLAAFWMYFIGAAYATHIRSHISAEIFSIYCTHHGLRQAVALVRTGLTVALALLYTYWAGQMFAWSLAEGGRTTVWQIPLVTTHTAILVGFVLMSWYFLVEFAWEVARTLGTDVPALDAMIALSEGDEALEPAAAMPMPIPLTETLERPVK
jgi:TRAP-type C4-dicarboxylate transport system, small permease component